MPTQSTLVTLLVAGIPAVAAIVAAVLAGIFAWRARRADAEAQRTRDLEARISERKYDIYKPMINLLRDMLGGLPEASPDQWNEIKGKLTDFSTWISIYGSDDAVQAFHNWMQAIYHNPPPSVLLRLYGDFMVAARKDMGSPETAVLREHLLGMKITDIYEHPDVIDPSFEEVCDRLGWQPPWLSSNIAPHQPE